MVPRACTLDRLCQRRWGTCHGCKFLTPRSLTELELGVGVQQSVFEQTPLVWMHAHVGRPLIANEALGPPESGPVSKFMSGPEPTPGWGQCAPSSVHTAHTKAPDCRAQQDADLGEGAQSSLSLPVRELLPSRSVTQSSEHSCGFGSGSAASSVVKRLSFSNPVACREMQIRDLPRVVSRSPLC